MSWHTEGDAILERAKDRLINDPGRLKGVEVIGVDEHIWRHTRKGDRYVTVIIDLTPVRDRTDPSRLHGHVNCTGFDGGSEHTEGSLS
ncbi:transposase [Actinomyces procaprae]|uniref:transposase n=1 Tax=Actinomyces procaprae TaxID=2560010 RepID=UPI0010A28167|nr:transposase [Actinomyces procaprae]